MIKARKQAWIVMRDTSRTHPAIVEPKDPDKRRKTVDVFFDEEKAKTHARNLNRAYHDSRGQGLYVVHTVLLSTDGLCEKCNPYGEGL